MSKKRLITTKENLLSLILKKATKGELAIFEYHEVFRYVPVRFFLLVSCLLLEARNESYSAFHNTFDKRFPKFVSNS